MNFKCLVLDHDDTVVNSTATIHFPSFIAYLEDYYPDKAGNYTLNDYFEKNFHPGILSLFCDEIGMGKKELEEEEKYWSDFVQSRVPKAYDGMRELISDFKAQGGIVAVASHSLTKYIERDYRENGLPTPDVIYGWDIPKAQRKPSPWCVMDLCERFALSPEEILVVDDLKPGYDMAKGAGAKFAAVGWAHNVEIIENVMRKSCDYYVKTVADLRDIIMK